MPKQAIIFDIDGTAINSPIQKVPTKRLVKAVEQLRQRFYLCAATGRVWSFAKPVLQGMKLSDPCIISAGTQICNPETGEILWECTIEPDNLIEAARILREYPDYKVLWNDYDDNDYLYGGHNPKDIDTANLVYFLEMVFVPESEADAIVQKLARIEGLAVLNIIAQRPQTRDIHITNKFATKEHAITELLKLLRLTKSDTIGVGDGHNDLHLFAGVNHKVAMSNGVAELKASADEIIGSVGDDGFATYLETLIPTL